MNLKNGKVFTSKSVGTGPSSYENRIYRAAVSQRLRNTVLHSSTLFYTVLHSFTLFYTVLHCSTQFYTVLHSSTRCAPTGVLFLELKRLGRDVDHWHSSSAEVRNEWNYTSMCLHRLNKDSFTFYLLVYGKNYTKAAIKQQHICSPFSLLHLLFSLVTIFYLRPDPHTVFWGPKGASAP